MRTAWSMGPLDAMHKLHTAEMNLLRKQARPIFHFHVKEQDKSTRVTVFAVRRWLCSQTCVAAWRCRHAIFPFKMPRNARRNASPHDEPKNREIFDEKRDTYVTRVCRKFLTRAARSERVALFSTYEHETPQGYRGRLLEYEDVVRFPEACVGSEKFAKYFEFSD